MGLAEEYAALRQRATQESEKQRQAAQRRLEQQAAAKGSLRSGAFVKLGQQLEEESGQQLEGRLGDINLQEQQAAREERLIGEGRQYQTQEREAGQAFGAGEAEKQRLYGTQERESAQMFAAGEAELGRAFSKGEREAVQAFQQAEREGAQDFASAEALLGREFSQAEREAIQAFQAGESGKQREFAREERLGVQEFEALQNELSRALQSRGLDQQDKQITLAFKEFEENLKSNLFNKLIALKDISGVQWQKAAELLGLSQEQVEDISQPGPIEEGSPGGNSQVPTDEQYQQYYALVPKIFKQIWGDEGQQQVDEASQALASFADPNHDFGSRLDILGQLVSYAQSLTPGQNAKYKDALKKIGLATGLTNAEMQSIGAW